MVVTLGHEQCNVGEKPIAYTVQLLYINRFAGTAPNETNAKDTIISLELQLNLLHWAQDRMGVDEGNFQGMGPM